MISFQTATCIGSIIGAVGGATLSRIGDQIADDVACAVSQAFSDKATALKETPIYESLSQRDFWIIGACGAGCGAFLGASLYQISPYFL